MTGDRVTQGQGYHVTRRTAADGKRSDEVKLQANAAIPPHRHDTGYTVHAAADATLVRVTHHEDGSETEEALQHRAGQSYRVPATAPGKKISIRNNGPTAAHFRKDLD